MRLKVGKIVNTHALKGEVKVISSSDFAEERFATGSKLLLTNGNQLIKEVEIETSRFHKGAFLIKFKDIHTIEEAEKIKNLQLKIDEQNLSELEEGEFYFYEIIGCEVFDDENSNKIGNIIDILQTGANDVWVIKDINGKEQLIPYINDVVKNIDIKNKKVYIEVIEGLLN